MFDLPRARMIRYSRQFGALQRSPELNPRQAEN